MRSMVRAPYSKLNAQISEEAAEWFVEFRTGEATAAERAHFDAWVRSSPEHLRAYLEIAAIWNESQALESRGSLSLDDEPPARANVIDLPSSTGPSLPHIDLRSSAGLPIPHVDLPSSASPPLPHIARQPGAKLRRAIALSLIAV